MPSDRYGSRPVGIRIPLPVVIIVCDDRTTAPAYFNELKRKVKQHVTVTIIPASRQGASPGEVVERAIAEYKNLAAGGSKGDAAWAVFDMEREAHCRTQAQEARERAEARKVNVALSDPCYEVWTLLHLEDTGQAFNDCTQVIDRVRQLWKARFSQPFDRKAQADYSKIIGFRQEAAARAKRHWEAEDPSRTEVYKIIETIELHVQTSEEISGNH